MNIGEALRLLRVFHDLKQTELSEKIGLSKSYISEIEGGTRVPSLETIDIYARGFQMPVSSIIFFAENLMEAKQGKNTTKKVAVVSSKVVKLLQFLEDV